MSQVPSPKSRFKSPFFTILACFSTHFLETTRPYYTALFKHSLLRVVFIGIVLLFLIPATYAQNTKGDRPEVSGGAKRESRFRKTPRKKKQKKQSYNRVQGRRTQANRASASRPAKLYPQKGRFVNNSSRTVKDARQNTRSASRVNSRPVTTQTRNVYPQRGRFVNNRSRTGIDARQVRKSSSRARVNVRSATGRTVNVYPQRGRFVNNPSRKPQKVERAVSNRQQLARVQSMSTKPTPPGRKKRVVPATASRPYISRKSINAFAGFWNQKPKGEKAYTRGDLAGRKIRGKNFESKRSGVIKATTTPYYGRKRVGDRPYKGPAGGGYVSATRPGRAWKGDIAGRKIRGRNFSSKQTVAGKPIFPPKKSKQRVGDRPYKGTIPGGGYRSASQSGEKRTGKYPVPVKTPGIGANKIGTYQGNIKGGRRFMGTVGADYSGDRKNTRFMGRAGVDYSGNIKNRKFIGRAGVDYSGNIKARKPLKGGGSVSGRLWNNRGQAIAGKSPGKGSERMGTYQGNLKLSQARPGFNRQGEDYRGNKKIRPSMRDQGEEYTGSLKGRRTLPADAKKVSGYPGNHKLFDLKPGMRNQGEEFTGYTKAKKPLKGGGSVSGKLWNNREQPIPVKTPKVEIGEFPGKHREFDLHPTMRNQGEEFTGHIRLPRFKRQYIRNPNSTDEALKKNRPDKSTYQVAGLQVKVKQQDYKKRPHAAEGSMLGIGPGKGSIKASEYSKAMRLKWNYVRNPNSAEEALKTWEPGKAFARATDYQGNIKMKKFYLLGKKDFHPDAQFVKTNKNNTDEERGVVTNFKLWWARLFKKNDTQPDYLKEKIRKPRYDKGEQGLWYD